MSTVYRFHDDVAINPPDGPSYYLTRAQARIMEQALYDVLRDISLRPFTRSSVGTVTLPEGEKGERIARNANGVASIER